MARTTTPPTPKFRSRRVPVLRVVASDRRPMRHVAVVERVDGKKKICEVFTFAQFEALTTGELIKDGYLYMLPGLGWLSIRDPIGDNEVEDFEDIIEQTKEHYWGASE